MDEPTTWELKRSLDAIRTDMRDGFGQLNTRLDRVVGLDVFQVYQQANDRRISEIESDVRRLEAAQSDYSTRLRIAVIVGAITLFTTVGGGLVLYALTGRI